MDREQELWGSAVRVNLEETFTFIRNFNETNYGVIESEIPTINGLAIEFKKGERCIDFSTGSILRCESPVRYQDSKYGFWKPFKIIHSGNKYSTENGAGSITLKLGKGFSSEGQIWNLESNFDKKEGFYKAIIPINKFAKIPVHYLLGVHFIVGEALRGAGYVDMVIKEYPIALYDYDLDKQSYIFIDCKSKIDFSLFESIVESIIYSFAFISGSLNRDEITFLKFGNADFTDLIGFKFNRVHSSIVSSVELINPREHKAAANLKNMIFFPIAVFSKLIELCLDDRRLLRAIKVITQSRNLPDEIKAASFFVALETIKQIIIDENINNLSPFVNSDKANKAIDELKKSISILPDDDFNDREAVYKSLDNLNRIGNNDSFKLAFELVGITLTKDEKNCIKMRNRFLHGNVPFENEPQQEKDRELMKISLNAHLLTCSLILKYVHYDGVVKNFLKYLDIMNDTNLINEPLFRKI